MKNEIKTLSSSSYNDLCEKVSAHYSLGYKSVGKIYTSKQPNKDALGSMTTVYSLDVCYTH